MKTEQQFFEQHFIPHTTQQGNGRCVFSLPTKIDSKKLVFSRLAADRRLHAFECKREQELKDHYHYFMRKLKELDHRFPVDSQEVKEHATL